MIILPKVRGFICTAAHPQGCFKAVQKQIDYVRQGGYFTGPKNVLVIGASTGYGLASRIAAAFGAKAHTLGISFERPADSRRTASPGWYNTAAFEQFAQKEGYQAKSINGDAFSQEIKQQAIQYIKNEMGSLDLIIYSLAAPRRQDPIDNKIYSSVLKPIGQVYHGKTVDPISGIVKEVDIEPANADEIFATEKVMGGEDWERWIEQLLSANLLANNAMTLAYSYIGPELTHSIYKNGTIGVAKQHLQKTAYHLDQKLAKMIDGRALISVNKALVTQASSAIPVVPLYISLLYKIMKEKGSHEGCIEQMSRLFKDRLYVSQGPIVDQDQTIRLDDWEMNSEVQETIKRLWPEITSENVSLLTDIAGYRQEFYQLFGFEFPGINYEMDVETDITIPSITEGSHIS